MAKSMNTNCSAPPRSFRRRSSLGIRCLWRDDSGVAAVEFAFIVPILVLLLTGIIQFGAVLFIQHNMGEIARESARRVAVGAMTKTEAEQFVDDHLVNWGATFDVAITVPDPADPTDTDVDVVITAPMSEVAFIDILGVFEGRTLRSASTMRVE
jgi:Flp pilus assembly pilin Flp